MLVIFKILTALSLFWIQSSCVSAQNSVISTFLRHWEEPTLNKLDDSFLNHLFPNSLAHTTYNDSVIYYSCFDLKDSANCNVTKRTWPSAHDTLLIICQNYKFPYSRKNYKIYFYRLSDNIVMFHFHKPPLYYSNDKDYHLNLNIFDIEKCSNIANISIKSKLENENIATFFPIIYDKTLELVVRNETYCNGIETCKITYDFNGKKINDPKPFTIEENSHRFYPVSYESSDKGFFSHAFYLDKTRVHEVIYFDQFGKSKKLMSTTQKFNFVFHKRLRDFSCGLFTTCTANEIDDQKIHCLQFDTNAIKMNVTIDLPKNSKTIAIHNLVGGGILVIVGHCEVAEINNSNEGSLTCNKFQIQKVTDEYNNSTVLVIDSFQNEFLKFKPTASWITENDKNEYCYNTWGTLRFPIGSENSQQFSEEVYYYKWCISKELVL